MSQVMEADMGQPGFPKNFSKGMADYARVKRVTVDMAEYEVAISWKTFPAGEFLKESGCQDTRSQQIPLGSSLEIHHR
jgi:hypothetical protein